jgi:hypothetical protein
MACFGGSELVAKMDEHVELASSSVTYMGKEELVAPRPD